MYGKERNTNKFKSLGFYSFHFSKSDTNDFEKCSRIAVKRISDFVKKKNYW